MLNLRKGPDCIQGQSYYCMSLKVSLGSSRGTDQGSLLAPVLSLVNQDHQTRRFNNSDPTFRGPPSESVSEAWDRLTQSMC